MINEEQKQLISAYYDNAVSEIERQQAETLLAQNPECRAYLNDLQKLSSVLPVLKDQTLSPDAQMKMLKDINKESSMQTNQLKVPALILSTLVIGALVLSTVQYSQRALQARVRDGGIYMTAPVMGKLKSSRSDFADQYDAPVNYQRTETRKSNTTRLTTQISDEGVLALDASSRMVMAKKSPQSVQYEPYYQKAEYSLANDKRIAHEAVIYGAAAASVRAAGSPVVLLGNVNGYVNQPNEYVQYVPSNTEEYKAINDNQFLTSKENPLSTFSIDVDTASYSNVRRLLTNNQMPPVDAVRIEEMINYFDYNYPEPGWNQPFSVTMEQGICPWNPSHQLVLVGLQGKKIAEHQTPESNLVFLVDVSGSMDSPDKLPLLKESLRMMVNQLRPQERVSLVVYAGAAGVVLDSTPGYDKQTILSAIDRLQAGGSTAGGQGIELAYAIAVRNFIPNGNNRVILATDGDFNVGISSESELTRLIEEKRQSGIFLTVLGLGTGNLKDAKMEQLADKGNGNYYYIDNLNEGKKVLVDELGSTIFTIAKDVKIQVEFNPAQVKEYRLVGYENRTLAKEDFNDDTKDAGELGAGHTVTALYEIVPAGSWESHNNVDALKYQQQATKKPWFSNDNEMMTVKLRYKEPNSNASQLITKVLNKPGYSFGRTWGGDSNNLQFASAVAEFGMLLRDSAFKGNSSYQDVIQRVQSSGYNDPWGYKAEFLSLVQKAQSLDQRQYQTNRIPMSQPYCPTCEYQVQQDHGYNQK